MAAPPTTGRRHDHLGAGGPHDGSGLPAGIPTIPTAGELPLVRLGSPLGTLVTWRRGVRPANKGTLLMMADTGRHNISTGRRPPSAPVMAPPILAKRPRPLRVGVFGRDPRFHGDRPNDKLWIAPGRLGKENASWGPPGNPDPSPVGHALRIPARTPPPGLPAAPFARVRLPALFTPRFQRSPEGWPGGGWRYSPAEAAWARAFEGREARRPNARPFRAWLFP